MKTLPELLGPIPPTLTEPEHPQPTPQRGSTMSAGRSITKLSEEKMEQKQEKLRLVGGTEMQVNPPVVSIRSLPPALTSLLDRTDVNWCGYEQNGVSTKPVPLIAKDSADYGAVVSAIAQIEGLMHPSQPQDILGLLAVLRLHKPDANLDEEQMTQKLLGYIEDLSEYPIDLIAEACVIYRRNPHEKFFPGTAQLREIIIPLWYRRKLNLQKLQLLRQKADNPPEVITEEQAEINRQRLGKMFADLIQELGG